MGDMSPCKHGGTVGYCGICNPELEELTSRIAELEAENARLTEGWRLNVEMLKQEVARLTTHIRAIAEHHDKQINFVESSDDIDYQTMRRDFALSGLEKP